MKKIFSLFIAAVALIGLYSCDEDRDSNPTFVEKDGATFVLNMPEYAGNNVYDLKNSSDIVFTTSQPDYGGFPLATTYVTQVSLDQEQWAVLSTTSQSTRVVIPAGEINDAILGLAGDADLSEPIPLYVKMNAELPGQEIGFAESNTIMLPQVLAYVPEVTIDLPKKMHIVGDFAASEGWNKFVPLHQIYSQEGQFYGVVYLQDGAEFKINPDAGWQGNDKGYDQVTPVDEAGAGYRMADGNNNMKVDNGGWYNVIVKTKVANGSVSYTVTIMPAEVYVIGAAEGGNWSKMDEWKFTAPADAGGEWMSPALAGSGELRMFIECGTDWWKTEFTIKSDGTLYYRDVDIPANWADNVGPDFSQSVNPGEQVHLNFTNETGYVR